MHIVSRFKRLLNKAELTKAEKYTLVKTLTEISGEDAKKVLEALTDDEYQKLVCIILEICLR